MSIIRCNFSNHMQSPYYIAQKNFIVSESLLPVAIRLLRDKSELSREDRFILEKHSHDIMRMLIKYVVAIEGTTQISIAEKQKIRRLLDEYLETNELLSRD